MPLDEKNIETTIRLIQAHQGRYAEIADVGTQLLRPHFWRSRDGSLELGQLTQENKDQLVAQINVILDEARVIENNIRQALLP